MHWQKLKDWPPKETIQNKTKTISKARVIFNFIALLCTTRKFKVPSAEISDPNKSHRRIISIQPRNTLISINLHYKVTVKAKKQNKSKKVMMTYKIEISTNIILRNQPIL